METAGAFEGNKPCMNPNCKSYGHVHPNCRCYAKGGCVGPHDPSCEYYKEGGEVRTYADGALVDPTPTQIHPPPDPQATLGHAVVHQGLINLLKNSGHPKMADPEKHHKTLDKAKAHMAAGRFDKATDVVHDHPMAGGVGKTNLKHIMEHLAPGVLTKESNPEALRSSVDYMNSALKGHEILKGHTEKTLGHDKLSIDSDNESPEKLKGYIEGFKKNPEQMLEIGGHLGHYQPAQAATLAAMAATATQYLDSLRPPRPQAGPLDDPMPPNNGVMAQWNRQLGIAEKPQLILKHIKEGTLQPQDLTTVKTIYPGLYSSMVSNAGEALIEAKTKNKEIPYYQKLALSKLLGQPLDGTMTPMAMQAIIKSAGAQQAQNQQKKQSGPKKASDVELRQINKVDEMSETPLEARQINRNRA